jgi:flagellin-like hook-associated protein FlgL
MNIDDAADELYGVPLAEFTSVRSDLAKQAKAAGDTELSGQIKAMRKPVAAAWVLNQLVRSERREVADLVALGEAMRSATAASDGATLRDLTATRKTLIAELIQAAKTLAANAGQPASAAAVNSVSDTLLAAVADPEAGAELLEGRLTKSLEHAGFGAFAPGGSAAVISLTAARTARSEKRPVQRKDQPRKASKDPTAASGDTREAALQELSEAESALNEAETRVNALRGTLSELRKRGDEARARVDRLAAELKRAERTLRDAEVAEEGADEDLEAARRDVEAAGRRRRDARLTAHRYTS